jgi:hypothetical protein
MDVESYSTYSLLFSPLHAKSRVILDVSPAQGAPASRTTAVVMFTVTSMSPLDITDKPTKNS